MASQRRSPPSPPFQEPRSTSASTGDQFYAFARTSGSTGVVVIIQANPQFPLLPDDLGRTSGLRDLGPSGFADFHESLLAETTAFDGQA